jgi:hypothetical protein
MIVRYTGPGLIHNQPAQVSDNQPGQLSVSMCRAYLQHTIIYTVQNTWHASISHSCAGPSGIVHSVFLINVYLDLENPGGSEFWVGDSKGVVEGNKGSQFTSIREQRWTDPDTEGGFQVINKLFLITTEAAESR